MTTASDRVWMRAAVTEQIVVELARESVDAYIIDRSVDLPARLWESIEADEDLNLTDTALAAIDLFGCLIGQIRDRHGIDEAASILDDVISEHQQCIVELAQRMERTAR